ncbi:putative soyasaponin III rhamnosyltransferase [Helianthus anomalus]
MATSLPPTNSSNDPKQLHVVMFPWLAFGHIIPFLELSKFIAQNGYNVSFLSTTRNIQRLPTLASHLSPLISLVKLTFPRIQELPHNAEATMDIGTDDIPSGPSSKITKKLAQCEIKILGPIRKFPCIINSSVI